MYDLGCMLVESRPFMVLDALLGLYRLKYDSATACGLPLYLFFYKLDSSATLGVAMLSCFCFKPRMVSDKNTQRNIFTIMFLCLFHKGIIEEGENSYYLPKVLVLGQKLVLGKPSNCASNW